MKTILLLMLAASSVYSDQIIPVLTINGQNYTNAHFGAVTGSKVILLYDGGGERMALSNLPPELQRQFNYDPERARQIEQIEVQRRAAAQQAANQTAAAYARARNTLGPSQKVHVIKVINESHLQIVGADGLISDAYIHNIPMEVIGFVRDLTSTQADADATKYDNDRETYTKQVGQGRNARLVPTTTRTDAAVSIAQTRLHLRDLLVKERAGASVIVAAPTEFYTSRSPLVRQWEYQATPAPYQTPALMRIP